MRRFKLLILLITIACSGAKAQELLELTARKIWIKERGGYIEYIQCSIKNNNPYRIFIVNMGKKADAPPSQTPHCYYKLIGYSHYESDSVNTESARTKKHLYMKGTEDHFGDGPKPIYRINEIKPQESFVDTIPIYGGGETPSMIFPTSYKKRFVKVRVLMSLSYLYDDPQAPAYIKWKEFLSNAIDK